MDPNAALAKIREAIKEMAEAKPTSTTYELAADELVESVMALDEWMSKGGFPPRAWWTDTNPPV